LAAWATQLTVSESITYLHVYAINACSDRAILKIGQSTFPCFLGKNGRTNHKREGDSKSPIGKWKLLQLYFRADKIYYPKSPFKTRELSRRDGWCDEPGNGAYNRRVILPCKANHEDMWRDDSAYDVLLTTTHNQRPRRQGGGSAIFLHVAKSNCQGTEGCIALSEKHLRQVLSRCRRTTFLVI
jgi:L,D-peptidoglycan transpeptidase YkuD (ErfK/YbiS/YcfS/YnhG family)